MLSVGRLVLAQRAAEDDVGPEVPHQVPRRHCHEAALGACVLGLVLRHGAAAALRCPR
jgi:hypothetical protein